MLRIKATERIDTPSKSNAVSVSEGRSRDLAEDDVVPGLGWSLYGYEWMVSDGYCDGSPVSWCHRTDNNDCLMYGHNDGRPNIVGDGLSGWVIITIPEVKEGLIFGRLEWWHPRGGTARTKTWTDVNNDEEVGGRNLGGYHPPWPEDSFVDIAVNGKIITTYNQTEFMAWKAEMAYNEAFYLLMDDKDLVQGDEPVSLELGIRLRSESDPKGVGLGITHIYYA